MRTGVLTSTSVLSNTTAPCCASTCQAPTDVTAATVTDSTVMASAVMTSTSVWTGRTGVSRIASTTTAASCASVALVTHCPLKVRCNWFHLPLLQTCRFACVFRDFFSGAKSTQATQTTTLFAEGFFKSEKNTQRTPLLPNLFSAGSLGDIYVVPVPPPHCSVFSVLQSYGYLPLLHWGFAVVFIDFFSSTKTNLLHR